MSLAAVTRQDVLQTLQEIRWLSDQLPKTIPEGEVAEKPYTIVSKAYDKTEGGWMVFNSRMDALYGEDCRDEAGRLKYIFRGPFGMHAVCVFITELLASDVAGTLPYDLVKIKLERIKNESTFLTTGYTVQISHC